MRFLKNLIWDIFMIIAINVVMVGPVLLLILGIDYIYDFQIDFFDGSSFTRIIFVIYAVIVQFVIIKEVFPSFWKKMRDYIY